jgi:hypothetical protein
MVGSSKGGAGRLGRREGSEDAGAGIVGQGGANALHQAPAAGEVSFGLGSDVAPGEVSFGLGSDVAPGAVAAVGVGDDGVSVEHGGSLVVLRTAAASVRAARTRSIWCGKRFSGRGWMLW